MYFGRLERAGEVGGRKGQGRGEEGEEEGGRKGRRTRLVLVFALNLEDVKEVGPRGVDLDQVLVWVGDRIREGGDFEVLWALGSVGIMTSERQRERGC